MVLLLESSLQARGHETVGVHDGQSALDRLDGESFDVLGRLRPVRYAITDRAVYVLDGGEVRRVDLPALAAVEEGDGALAFAVDASSFAGWPRPGRVVLYGLRDLEAARAALTGIGG